MKWTLFDLSKMHSERRNWGNWISGSKDDLKQVYSLWERRKSLWRLKQCRRCSLRTRASCFGRWRDRIWMDQGSCDLQVVGKNLKTGIGSAKLTTTLTWKTCRHDSYPYGSYTLLDCAYGKGAHGSREHGEDCWNLHQSLMIRKKECEYFLFDFIPRDLKEFCCSAELYWLRTWIADIMRDNWVPAPSRGLGGLHWQENEPGTSCPTPSRRSMHSSPRKIAEWGYLWKSYSPTD